MTAPLQRVRPRRLVVAVLAAVLACTALVTCARAATRSPSTHHVVAYLTAPPSGQHAGALTTRKPRSTRWPSTTAGRGTGWLLLDATTTTGATLRRTPPAPDGRGYLWPSAPGTTLAVAAGGWQPTVTLKASESVRVRPAVRVFTVTAGRYHQLFSTTGRATTLSGNAHKLRLPAVQRPAISLPRGARLYVDVLVEVTTSPAGQRFSVLHSDGTGSSAQLVLPRTRTVAAPTAVASGQIWHPKPGTTWQWQITGKVDTSFDVQMYDIDLYDAQPAASSYSVPGFGTVDVPQGENAGVIGTLHAQGRVVVCYLDSGAYESYRPDAALFPKAVIGNSTGWRGESWLDIRPASWSKFEPLIAARLDLAKRSGCDGVEPDQNNPLGNDPGFPITAADQKAWYLEVARLAHERGLSVGQKNGIETTDADTIAAFDWNLNEECRQYDECGVLAGYVAAGKAVFQVEYQDEGATTSFCPADDSARFSGLLKRRILDAWRIAC